MGRRLPDVHSSSRLTYVEKSDPLFVPSLEVTRKWLLVCGHYCEGEDARGCVLGLV